MSTTRISLLKRIRDPRNNHSWEEFVDIYRPVIAGVIRSFRINAVDSEDILQEVLLQMSKTARNFEVDSDKGKFRSYLRQVTANKVRDYCRRRKKLVRNIEQPSSIVQPPDLEEVWEDEFHRSIFRVAMKRVRQQARELTWTCFQEHVVHKRNAEVVADELGISTNAVYINSSRIMTRLRDLSLQLKKEYDSESC